MQATGMVCQAMVALEVLSITSAMASTNSTMNMTEMTNIMMEFQRQNKIAAVKEKMMNDALADAFNSEEMEE
eukprot:13520893-Ditylum_brightwellii.AAC.1